MKNHLLILAISFGFANSSIAQEPVAHTQSAEAESRAKHTREVTHNEPDAEQWTRFQKKQQESLSEDKQLVQRESLRSPAAIRAEISRVRQEMAAETMEVNAGRVNQAIKDQAFEKMYQQVKDRIDKALHEDDLARAQEITANFNAELEQYNQDKADWKKRDKALVNSIDTKGAHLVTLQRELKSQPSSEEIRSEIAQLKAEIARDKGDKAKAAEKEKKRQQNLNAEKGRLQREYAAETDKRKKSEIFTALNDLRVKDQRERSEWQNYDIAKLNKIAPAERRLAALEKLLRELEPSQERSDVQAATIQPYFSPNPPEKLEVPATRQSSVKPESGYVPAKQQKPQVTPRQPAARQPEPKVAPRPPPARRRAPKRTVTPKPSKKKDDSTEKQRNLQKFLDILK